MTIRKAELKDLEEMAAIYNYEVLNGVSTFDIKEKTTEDRLPWFNEHNRDNHPLIVAEEDGKTVGYACLSPYRYMEAYNTTVELSVYIAPDYRRFGIGRALMDEILKYAYSDPNTHAVVSLITSSNEASINLHREFGFEFCGKMREVGIKFGEYHDVSTYQIISLRQ